MNILGQYFLLEKDTGRIMYDILDQDFKPDGVVCVSEDNYDKIFEEYKKDGKTLMIGLCEEVDSLKPTVAKHSQLVIAQITNDDPFEYKTI